MLKVRLLGVCKCFKRPSVKTRKENAQCETCPTRADSVFCDLTASLLKDIDHAKNSHNYEPRHVLFNAGDIPRGIYCVSAGKIKIVKIDADGHQHIVRIAGPGDVLGYRALLADEPYSATAETIEASHVCHFDKSIFLRIIEQHPATALRMMSKLAHDVRDAENQAVNIVHRSVRERLAELLLVFHKKYGRRDENGVLLDIRLTREELAELIGSTQESVIRTLSLFKKEELIGVRGRSIIVKNVSRLADVANIAEY